MFALVVRVPPTAVDSLLALPYKLPGSDIRVPVCAALISDTRAIYWHSGFPCDFEHVMVCIKGLRVTGIVAAVANAAWEAMIPKCFEIGHLGLLPRRLRYYFLGPPSSLA